MNFCRITIVLITGCVLNQVLPAGPGLRLPLSPAVAYGEESWKTQLSELCAKTNESMSLSVEELTALVAGCDKLKPVIEGLEESPRKVYRKRLQMCRDLYAYVLEIKAQQKPAPKEQQK
jgi:hypothetical protein